MRSGTKWRSTSLLAGKRRKFEIVLSLCLEGMNVICYYSYSGVVQTLLAEQATGTATGFLNSNSFRL